MVRKGILSLSLICLFLLSCKKEFHNVNEFYKWWNNEANGLTKVKTINDFKLSVRFMPENYLVYNAMKGNRSLSLDSIKNKYKNSLTFLLTIEPINERKSEDLLFQNAESLEEYKER